MTSANYKLAKFSYKFKSYFTIKFKPSGMSELQQKVYDLFVMYVKDSSSELICSIKTHKRHIRNGDLLIMLYSSSNGYIITVIDESDKHNIYDVDLKSDRGGELCNLFDIEMERKLRGCEFEKRTLIINDLDELMKKKKKQNVTKLT